MRPLNRRQARHEQLRKLHRRSATGHQHPQHQVCYWLVFLAVAGLFALVLHHQTGQTYQVSGDFLSSGASEEVAGACPSLSKPFNPLAPAAHKPDQASAAAVAKDLNTENQNLPLVSARLKFTPAEERQQLHDTLQKSLTQRKQLLLEAMEQNPGAAWGAIMSSQKETRPLAKRFQNCFEQPVTLRGGLALSRTDFFPDHSPSVDRYGLNTADVKTLNLHFVAPPGFNPPPLD